jgi:hypothetical protein
VTTLFHNIRIFDGSANPAREGSVLVDGNTIAQVAYAPEVIDGHGAPPRSVTLSGHNHYTMAMHLGSSDRRLAHEIAAFIKDVA